MGLARPPLISQQARGRANALAYGVGVTGQGSLATTPTWPSSGQPAQHRSRTEPIFMIEVAGPWGPRQLAFSSAEAAPRWLTPRT